MFIAYYLHWSEKDIWAMPHELRRRYCTELSALHERLSPQASGNPFAI